MFMIVKNYLFPSLLFLGRRTLSSTKQIKEANDKNMASRIVWIDLELTGLNIETDKILEIACLVTDSQLDIITEGLNIIIHQPEDVLISMNQWCITQHAETGLTEASRNSTINTEQAEEAVLSFIKSVVPEKRCPLGGNSVYMDRIFIRKHMPKIDDYLHYRIIDVSTVKELAKRWFPKEYSRIPQKKFTHRAMNDIIETVNELKYYRQHIFKNDESCDQLSNRTKHQ